MPNIIYAGSNSFSPGGTITISENTTLSGGGSNVAFAVGAFTGTNGLAPTTYTSFAEWRQLANRFKAKTDEISANAINVDLDCSDAVVVGSSSADNITLRATGLTEIYAGDGDDTISVVFIGYYGKSVINGGTGDDIINGAAGNDDLRGGTGQDTLSGGFGSDNLSGGSGIDTMSGGLGSDWYSVEPGDVIIEEIDQGIDTVSSLGNWQLGNNFENLFLAPVSFAITGRGNALNNTISGNSFANSLLGGDGNDKLYGDGGADTLYGQEGADTLYGDAGADVLDGGAGNDWLEGGADDDIYIVRDTGDFVSEQANGGHDLVRTTINLILFSDVEALVLMGGAGIGTGNALDNDISGNKSNNSLYGVAGQDQIFGNGGRDTIDGGVGNDILHGGQGIDTLTGGADADRFVFADGDTSRNSLYADAITDFNVATGDLINLARIDANTALEGDQAFTFIGTAAFGGTASQLRFEVMAGNTWVQMDTTGDGVADYQIRLNGAHALTAGDFVL